MEQASWLTAFLLAFLALPPAVAESPVSTFSAAGLCVDPEGPSVNYNACGPSVAVVITLDLDDASYSWRFGCERDCDRTINVWLCVRPAPVADVRSVLFDKVNQWMEDLERSIETSETVDFVAGHVGAEPPQGCSLRR